MAHYEQGLYDCVVTGQGFGESKNNKTPCFFLKFNPVKLGEKFIDAEYEREVQLWLTEKTADRVVEQLRGMGWQGGSFKDLEPNGSHSFRGANIQVRCTYQQDGEKVYEKWELPLPQSQQTEHVDGLARKLDAMFGKAIKNGKKAEAAPAKAMPAPAPNDEVPF